MNTKAMIAKLDEIHVPNIVKQIVYFNELREIFLAGKVEDKRIEDLENKFSDVFNAKDEVAKKLQAIADDNRLLLGELEKRVSELELMCQRQDGDIGELKKDAPAGEQPCVYGCGCKKHWQEEKPEAKAVDHIGVNCPKCKDKDFYCTDCQDEISRKLNQSSHSGKMDTNEYTICSRHHPSQRDKDCPMCQNKIKVDPPQIVTKADAIYEAIQTCDVGDTITIHNTDGSPWCILKVEARDLEH